ncbi:MAG: hypothetical protein JWM16_2406 [Verrucomicrobiales bacterium]|nr:hypothetical protein [Verrucomicrobiales bacterium]
MKTEKAGPGAFKTLVGEGGRVEIAVPRPPQHVRAAPDAK